MAIARHLQSFGLAATLFFVATLASAAPPTELPIGGGQPALVSGYFPDRVHEFVWRNWNLVEPARLAKVLSASEQDVLAIAESMGLPPSAVEPAMMTRGYATLIRRNWHLLPYEQLLKLLDWTPERLSFTLREEDFLWVKLGRTKPQCEPLRYQSPSDAAKQRAAEIRQVVEAEFGPAIQQPGVPRFDFVRQLSLPLATASQQGSADDANRSEEQQQRIVYSYVAVYGDPLLTPELNPYPDGLLQRLAAVGINGVWLQGLLRDLAPGGAAFPEFGQNHQERLENLRSLVAQARKHGIGVYLYLNEPRAMPAEFFQAHPELAGVRSGELTALCTSQPAVRQWMGDALEYVFREVPELAGVYAITASENLTNCASHGDWSSCPRCKDRTDADVIAEVNAVIEAGVHRGNPHAKVLLSDWGWKGHGDAPDIIAKLPKAACLMSVSEWSLPIERGGVVSQVGEYSISAVGPGPRATRHWELAQQAGLQRGTEIQFNNTCELASIPYLPVMDLVAEHCQNLAPQRLDAMLIGWTMGGYPSPNFRVAQEINKSPQAGTAAALDVVAHQRDGAAGAPTPAAPGLSSARVFGSTRSTSASSTRRPCSGARPILSIRRRLTTALRCGASPTTTSPAGAAPIRPKSLLRSLKRWCKAGRRDSPNYRKPSRKLPATVARTPRPISASPRRRRYTLPASLIKVAFVHARDTLASGADKITAEEKAKLRQEMESRVKAEISLAKQLYPLAQADSHLGFEPSCQYFYLPLDLVEKVVNCRWLLDQAPIHSPRDAH